MWKALGLYSSKQSRVCSWSCEHLAKVLMLKQWTDGVLARHVASVYLLWNNIFKNIKIMKCLKFMSWFPRKRGFSQGSGVDEELIYQTSVVHKLWEMVWCTWKGICCPENWGKLVGCFFRGWSQINSKTVLIWLRSTCQCCPQGKRT